MNPFLVFHELTEPVVNIASVVFIGLPKLPQADLLFVTESVGRRAACVIKSLMVYMTEC